MIQVLNSPENSNNKTVKKVRCMQEMQRSAERGSHMPASDRYLRYVSTALNRTQLNMLRGRQVIYCNKETHAYLE